jgi:putative DNA primase/helicase
MLLDVTAADEAIQKLDRLDFFIDAHQNIFAAIQKLLEGGGRPNLPDVVEALYKDSKIEAVPGGAAYVASLYDGVPAVCPLLAWVDTIKQKAALRVRASIGEKITNRALNSNGDALQALEDIAILSLPLVQTFARKNIQARVVSGSELLQMKVEPREWLLDNFLSMRSMNEIFAWRGVGKTWAALSLSHAIATGEPWLKWKAANPRPVLYVDGELDAASLQQRIRHLDAQGNCPADKLRLLCCDMQDDPFPHLATRAGQIMIEDALGDSDFLVLDNLSALASSSNATEGEEWNSIQAWLLDLRRRGVASLFLHHAGHAGWARGTTRREDLLDVVVELKRPKDYVASEGLRVELHFSKTRGMMADGAEPIEASLGTDIEGRLHWTWRAIEDARTQQIIELRNAGHTFREIEKLTEIPRSTAERLYKSAGLSQ